MDTPKLMQTTNGTSQERYLEHEDTEISIFDAQRYFNGTTNDATRVCKRVSPMHDQMGARFSSASSADEYGGSRTYRVRSFHVTPTASSEASWNSQTGLLSNPPGAIPVSMTMRSTSTINDHNRKGSSKMKWLWGRRYPCPCSGKKSVQVEPKTPSATGSNHKNSNHKREEILLSRDPHKILLENELLARNPHKILSENEFRNSSFVTTTLLENRLSATEKPVAKPSVNYVLNRERVGFSFPILNQQQPTTTSPSSHLKMAQDSPRDSLEIFQPKKLSSSRITTDDDVGSDTSSDLFEIESFSTTTQTQTTSNPPCHRRDSLDEASNFNSRTSMTMNECYEPSEVSIDWSVTTAEGFERASVADETVMITAAVGGKKKSSSGGDGGGLLLSCRCDKAVSVVVGPNPVKNVSPQRQAANTSKHVVNVNKPPLARLSLPFTA